MHGAIQTFYEQKYTGGTEVPRTSKQYTVDCVPGGAKSDILDVGCGSGFNSALLAAKGPSTARGSICPRLRSTNIANWGLMRGVCDIESGLDYKRWDIRCRVLLRGHRAYDLARNSRHRDGAGAQTRRSFLCCLHRTPRSGFTACSASLGYTVSELQHPKHFQFFSRRSLLKVLTRAYESFEPKQVSRPQHVSDPPGPAGAVALNTAEAWVSHESDVSGPVAHFWHLSHKSSVLNTLLADCLIVVMTKTRSAGPGERLMGQRTGHTAKDGAWRQYG